MKITVRYNDGTTEEYDIPTNEHGGWDTRIPLDENMDSVDDLHEDLAENASSGVVPVSIEDEYGKHYYVEWTANVVPAHEG